MKVLFVCMGNICRSPTALAVTQRLLRERAPHLAVEFDSAGTHDYHIGQPPDRRTLSAAVARGYDLSAQRARQVTVEDFARFDLVLAMDRANVAALRTLAPAEHHGRIRLFLEFAEGVDELEVPDPFYGGEVGFERVLDLAERAAEGLLEALEAGRL